MKYFILFLVLCFPAAAHAAELRAIPPTFPIRVGDQFIIEVALSGGDELINALEGQVELSPNLAIRAITTAESIVTLWLTEPYENARSIEFAGIIPGGFHEIIDPRIEGPRAGSVFKVIAEAQHAGEASVAFSPDTRAYLQNTEGVQASLKRTSASFVVRDSLGDSAARVVISSDDHVRPEVFSVSRVSGTLFDVPNNVLVFHAEDKQTGIRRYEFARSFVPLPEKLLSWSVTENPHILSKLDTFLFLYVRAVDGAGNTRVVGTASLWSLLFPIVLGAGLLLLFSRVLHRRG